MVGKSLGLGCREDRGALKIEGSPEGPVAGPLVGSCLQSAAVAQTMKTLSRVAWGPVCPRPPQLGHTPGPGVSFLTLWGSLQVSGVVFFSVEAAERLLATHVSPPLDACTYMGLDSGVRPGQVPGLGTGRPWPGQEALTLLVWLQGWASLFPCVSVPLGREWPCSAGEPTDRSAHPCPSCLYFSTSCSAWPGTCKGRSSW